MDRRAFLASCMVAGLLALGAAPGAAAKVAVKGGKYSGKTTQQAVAASFRKVEFRVKKGKVTLTTEPTVARGLCLSTPVFTLGGETPAARLSGKGTFSFTRTFIGSRFDRIKGHFTSANEVEGIAVYNFFAQDLCSEGKTKVRWTAKK